MVATGVHICQFPELWYAYAQISHGSLWPYSDSVSSSTPVHPHVEGPEGPVVI